MSQPFHIQAEPRFLPEQSDPAAEVYTFAYTITVTNRGDAPAQLVARHWLVCDARGHTQEVKGLGVVGRQPLLKPGESFQYESSCSLRTPSGTMHGSYLVLTEQGTPFEAPIPMFVLDAQASAGAAAGAGRVLH